MIDMIARAVAVLLLTGLILLFAMSIYISHNEYGTTPSSPEVLAPPIGNTPIGRQWPSMNEVSA